jgi:hypothetical protein
VTGTGVYSGWMAVRRVGGGQVTSGAGGRRSGDGQRGLAAVRCRAAWVGLGGGLHRRRRGRAAGGVGRVGTAGGLRRQKKEGIFVGPTYRCFFTV